MNVQEEEVESAQPSQTNLDFDPWTQSGWMTPAQVKTEVSNDRKYFKKVRINSSAAAKMLEHASHGVEKGRKRTGMPIEIMGLLVGKIQNSTFVIFDTMPLPVEGTEAQVVANDGAAMTHPFEAMPYMEARGLRFIGWYHSHPFDIQRDPHWFMSAIDCQSQTLFQNSYSQAWVAIVIDPIRSLHKKALELGSFYCYPPEYNPPDNEGPDGMICSKEDIFERWGNAYKRYYVLETDFFMSRTVQNNLRPVFDNWKECFSKELERDETGEQYEVSRLRTMCNSVDPSQGNKGGFGRNNIDQGLLTAKRLNGRISTYECRCRGYAQMIKHLVFNPQSLENS